MSKPRPTSSRDELEPSYEQDFFLLGGKEADAVEDEIHRRLAAGSRRSGESAPTSGNSFWRTASSSATTTDSQQGPSFSSVSLKKDKQDIVKERKASNAATSPGPGLVSLFAVDTDLVVLPRASSVHGPEQVSFFSCAILLPLLLFPLLKFSCAYAACDAQLFFFCNSNEAMESGEIQINLHRTAFEKPKRRTLKSKEQRIGATSLMLKRQSLTVVTWRMTLVTLPSLAKFPISSM
jgi:hypothetical protein